MRILLFILILINADCFAQPRQIVKIAKNTSLDRLKENLYYLASDKMEGRMFASHGDTLASLYIADWFKKCNLKPTYENGNSYFQTVIVHKRNIEAADMEVNGKTFSKYNGWVTRLGYKSLKNIPLVFVGYGVSDSSYNDFENIDVKGKAVVFILARGGRLAKNIQQNNQLTIFFKFYGVKVQWPQFYTNTILK